jgi:hypothetical protein
VVVLGGGEFFGMRGIYCCCDGGKMVNADYCGGIGVCLGSSSSPSYRSWDKSCICYMCNVVSVPLVRVSWS